MKTNLIYACITSLACAGCVSSVTTVKYHESKPNHGIVYALPETRLKVTVTYTVRKEVTVSNGIPVSTSRNILIAKPVTLDPVLAPDPLNRFVLTGDKLTKDCRLDSSFTFAVDDNQLLTSVSAEATDQTAAAIGSFVSAGISIAKLVAAAGENANLPPVLAAISARLAEINNEVALALVATNKSITNRTDRLKDLVGEQIALQTELTKYLELNTVKTDDQDVIYTEILDLRDFTPGETANVWTRKVQAPASRFGKDTDQDTIPFVAIDAYLTEQQHSNATKAYSLCCKGKNAVLCREVTPVRCTVTVNHGKEFIPVLDTQLPFAQVGPVNALEARYKNFGKRTTTINFSAATTSSLATAAGALNTSAANVDSAVADIRKAQTAADAARKSPEQQQLDELSQKKKLLDAEADLIKSQRALDALKAGPSN